MIEWTFEAVEDRRLIAAPPLRFVLSRDVDRWTHALGLDAEDSPVELVRSLEADPSRDDPARVVSPAFQEFHWHPEGDPGVALLTGQLTPHHFSAAIAFRADPAFLEVRFDVADRCRSPVDGAGEHVPGRGDVERPDLGRSGADHLGVARLGSGPA